MGLTEDKNVGKRVYIFLSNSKFSLYLGLVLVEEGTGSEGETIQTFNPLLHYIYSDTQSVK